MKAMEKIKRMENESGREGERAQQVLKKENGQQEIKTFCIIFEAVCVPSSKQQLDNTCKSQVPNGRPYSRNFHLVYNLISQSLTKLLSSFLQYPVRQRAVVLKGAFSSSRRYSSCMLDINTKVVLNAALPSINVDQSSHFYLYSAFTMQIDKAALR